MSHIIHVDHLVVGGGVVGLAVAAALVQKSQLLAFTSSASSSSSFRWSSRKTPSMSVLLVDKNPRLGDETSSRNSEVVHAGLYYPSGSWKTRLCVRGRAMLYEQCRQHGVAHRKCGKWIVAGGDGGGSGGAASSPTREHAYLAQLKEKADGLGVPVRFLSQREIRDGEPHLQPGIRAALESPESGIVDSHGLMQMLEGQILSSSSSSSSTSMIALKHRVDSIQWHAESQRYRTSLTTNTSTTTATTTAAPQSTKLAVHSRTVINAGGLWADEVARKLFISDGDDDDKDDVDHHHQRRQPALPQDLLATFTTHPCKGHYYTYTNDTRHLSPDDSGSSRNGSGSMLSTVVAATADATKPLVSSLIYPIPPDDHLTSLGIHCTIDLAGKLRLGPDTEYVARKDDYWIDMDGSEGERARKHKFWSAVERYLDIGDRDRHGARMKVDYAGIRPKLATPQNPAFRDFILREESEHGFPGFVNLVGIESPGLTASLAIAEHVVDELLRDQL